MSLLLIREGTSKKILNTIISYIKKGYAVLVKTDTQWGIMSLDADLIYQIKQRPRDKQLIQLVPPGFKFSGLNRIQKDFINKFWPGSVTVIKNGNAYRLTNRKMLNLIILELGCPIYCSSANISGGDPIHSVEDALTIFNHAHQRLICLVPSLHNQYNWSDNKLPSTIVDIDYWYIVRKGICYDDVFDYITLKVIPYIKKIKSSALPGSTGKFMKNEPAPNPYDGVPMIGFNEDEIEMLRELKNYRDMEDIRKAQALIKKQKINAANELAKQISNSKTQNHLKIKKKIATKKRGK